MIKRNIIPKYRSQNIAFYLTVLLRGKIFYVMGAECSMCLLIITSLFYMLMECCLALSCTWLIFQSCWRNTGNF